VDSSPPWLFFDGAKPTNLSGLECLSTPAVPPNCWATDDDPCFESKAAFIAMTDGYRIEHTWSAEDPSGNMDLLTVVLLFDCIECNIFTMILHIILGWIGWFGWFIPGFKFCDLN